MPYGVMHTFAILVLIVVLFQVMANVGIVLNILGKRRSWARLLARLNVRFIDEYCSDGERFGPARLSSGRRRHFPDPRSERGPHI
jgi:hypothetical protein